MGLGVLAAVLLAIAIANRRSANAANATGEPLLPAVKNQGVPFADLTGRVWPVITKNPSRTLVPYLAPDGSAHPAVTGNRYFGAARQDGLRKHAAIDLVADPGDVIVAAEPGRVVAFATGFSIGAGLDAVVIEHDGSPGVSIVYAEIVRDPSLVVGAPVAAGQKIGVGGKNSSGNSMLHFETWRKGSAPSAFTPWWAGKDPPVGLLDPTRYLLALATMTGKANA